MRTDKEIYIDFTKDRYVPVFFRHWYLDAVCDVPWDVVVVGDQENELNGAFIYMLKTKLGLKYIVQPQNCPYTGPIFFGEESKKRTFKQLMVKLPEVHFQQQDYHFQIAKLDEDYLLSKRQTFIINKGTSITELYDNLGKTYRYKIRNAKKNLKVEDSEDFSEFMSFLELEFEKRNRPLAFPKKSFQSLDRAVLIHGKRTIKKATDSEGNTVAMAYFLEDEKWVYNFANAFSKSSRHHAMNLLIWQQIERAIQSGKSFDFEGSSVPGIAEFYKRFGGERVVYIQHHYSKNKIIDWMVQLKSKS